MNLKSLIKKILQEENENKMKHFLITDKTGRSMKPYKLDITHIQKHWDLTEMDWDDEQSLGDFLEDCYIGDIWNTRTEKIECISVN
jgi:hypothetical protein